MLSSNLNYSSMPSGVKKGCPATLTNFGSNSHRENNHAEETGNILI